MGGIQTEEDFERFFNEIQKNAKEILIRDGHHTSLFFIVSEDGSYGILPFDQFCDTISKQFDTKDPERVKSATFWVIGQIARNHKCIGYIHVAEAWSISPPNCTDPNDVIDELGDIKNKYGGSLEFVPGRVEILSLAGRFKDTTRLVAIKIKRLGKDIYLEPYHDISGKYEGPMKTKIQSVDDAIDETLGKPPREKFEEEKEEGHDRPGQRRPRW